MFSLEERKKYTKKIIDYGEYLFSNKKLLGDKIMNGYILVIIHWIITGIPLYYLFFGEKNNKYYYISCLIWIIIFLLHFYFKGCILTRIERQLWQDKKWWGPWVFLFTPLEKIGIPLTDELANIIFISWGVLILSTILFRSEN